jgi:hypothetical protein
MAQYAMVYLVDRWLLLWSDFNDFSRHSICTLASGFFDFTVHCVDTASIDSGTATDIPAEEPRPWLTWFRDVALMVLPKQAIDRAVAYVLPTIRQPASPHRR